MELIRSRMNNSFWRRRHLSLQPYTTESQWPVRTLPGNLDHDDFSLRRRPGQAAKTEYIYCIKLPQFECTPQSAPARAVQPPVQHNYRQATRQAPRYRPYYDSLYLRRYISSTNVVLKQLQIAARHNAHMATQLFQSPWVPYEVVKIGKSENPARRFHDILGAFQNIPEVEVPLLQEIDSTDDPETVLQKAKLLDSVIFLVKVQDIGTAEGDIRKALGISLGQGFTDHFMNCLDSEEQKKHFEENAGMTEWVMMDSDLAAHLQNKFRYTRLFQSHQNLFGYVVPSGNKIHRTIHGESINYFYHRDKQLPPAYLISFQGTNFHYHLKIGV